MVGNLVLCEKILGVEVVALQVNGVNLTEIEGGEAAITNLHSCNGPDFIILLRFSLKKENAAGKTSGGHPFLLYTAAINGNYTVNFKSNIFPWFLLLRFYIFQVQRLMKKPMSASSVFIFPSSRYQNLDLTFSS